MSAAPQPRKPLTKKKRAQIALDQGGRCGCSILPTIHPRYADFPVCGLKLNAGEGSVDEHLHPLNAGGSNDRENRALLRAPCARLKTSKYDAPLIAHVKRCAGETGQHKRRAERKAKGKSLFQPGRKLQSRGFDKRYRKKVNGTVERRAGA